VSTKFRFQPLALSSRRVPSTNRGPTLPPSSQNDTIASESSPRERVLDPPSRGFVVVVVRCPPFAIPASCADKTYSTRFIIRLDLSLFQILPNSSSIHRSTSRLVAMLSSSSAASATQKTHITTCTEDTLKDLAWAYSGPRILPLQSGATTGVLPLLTATVTVHVAPAVVQTTVTTVIPELMAPKKTRTTPTGTAMPETEGDAAGHLTEGAPRLLWTGRRARTRTALPGVLLPQRTLKKTQMIARGTELPRKPLHTIIEP